MTTKKVINMSCIQESELLLLSPENLSTSQGTDNVPKCVQHFCGGQFHEVLLSDLARSVLQNPIADDLTLLNELLKRNVEKYFDGVAEGDASLRSLELLTLAASCLQLFVQNNWLGPRPSYIRANHVLPKYMFTDSADTGEPKLREIIETGLSADGEPVYGLATGTEFLFLAKFLLFDCGVRYEGMQTVDWWRLRCVRLQQNVLDDKSNTLRESASQLVENVAKIEPLMTIDKYRDLKIQFHLEVGHVSHMYYNYREAKQHFATARKLSGLDIHLTGVMGKRTRYQQEDTSQLVLSVSREPADDSTGSVEVSTGSMEVSQQQKIVVPQNFNLDDEAVLDAINFSDDSDVRPTKVSAVEQAMILGVMEDLRRRRASQDVLTEEEVHAYLSYVLEQVSSWSVSVSALLLRSKLERHSRRRVERSLKQLEDLYNHTQRAEPPVGQRLHLFYTTTCVPVWNIQSQMADILMSLGAIGSALEIFEQLQMWESAIDCYQRMGKVEKAGTVIREQLAVKETPNLLCFLGDITQNVECYEKAWELSKHRSARAQRCLGYIYFRKENFEKCLECFDKALSVNALQVPVWFTYGCAAMAAENYKLAVKAFKRCVSLDYDNFEAWNNLASAYIKLKEKKKAFLTLNDALKCEYENWRIWENFMVVGTDCREFGHVIRAYHRLIDLREKWVDEEILRIVVHAVTANIADADGRPAEYLVPKLKELLGRITAKVTNNGEIWSLYSKLCQAEPEKALQFLQKAHRCVTQATGWEKTVDSCQDVSKQALQLADAYDAASGSASNSTQAIQMLSSAKLMLKGLLSKIKQQHTDPITQEMTSEEVKVMCHSLDERMNGIVQKITELKSS